MFTLEETRPAALLADVDLVHVSSAGLPADPMYKAAAWARLRWPMSCRCIASVLLWGKLQSTDGRIVPGIREEASYALALGQPLYVVGACDGCAQLIGNLLGLSDVQKNLTALASPVLAVFNDRAKMLELQTLLQSAGSSGAAADGGRGCGLRVGARVRWPRLARQRPIHRREPGPLHRNRADQDCRTHPDRPAPPVRVGDKQ